MWQIESRSPAERVLRSLRSTAAAGKKVRCPKCQKLSVVPDTDPAPDQGDSELDLGQLELPAAPAYVSGRVSKRKHIRNRKDSFLRWIDDHRWVTAIAMLNLVALVSSVFVPPILLVLAINFPIGIGIVGLLFVPRLQTLKRVREAAGGVTWNFGVGGILIVMVTSVLSIMRAIVRSSNNPNLDFSGMLDPAIFDPISLIGVVRSFTIMSGVIALFFVLWRFIGLARMLAAGYCAELSFLIVGLMLGGVVAGHRDGSNRKRLHELERSSAIAHVIPSDAKRRQSRERRSAPMSKHDANAATDFKSWRNPARSNQLGVAVEASQKISPSPDPSATRPSPASPAPSRRVKRRPINIPLPNGTVQVDDDTPLVPGIKLSSCYTNNWYVVTVVKVHDDGTVLVNWDDWKSFTYDMTRDDLIISEQVLAQIGQQVSNNDDTN